MIVPQIKEPYVSPECEVLEMNPEGAILQMSGGPYSGFGDEETM